jgi:Coenzyme Q (ubiquinone) biosynthesis protein Coq4
VIYAPEMTLKEARVEYFRRSGFAEDGGYDERWIKVKVWRFPIWLPNTAGRVAAVKLHDLHHVLTEYPTTWRGEAEISAWEVGSGGLQRFWAGWWLDLMNVAQGLVVNPRGVYSGFMRGRQTSNLFAVEFNEGLLQSPVGEFRRRLKLEKAAARTTVADHLAFGFWVTVSALIYMMSVGPLVLMPLLIAYWIFLGLR